LLATLTTAASAASPSVDEKLLKLFKQSFPTAKKVSWYESGSSYEVYFENNEIKYKVKYDAEGQVVRTERYYGARELPPFIIMKLKQRFGDKEVFGVTEITTDEGLKYHITLQDQDRWYQVVSNSSGQLSLERKFKKA
ncbi:MAG TPA: hypothetical protein VHK69_13940, partial [Chitinophagaceae bacterium]|nr:hypothetical protein [Chitinophagaceae bacterium]